MPGVHAGGSIRPIATAGRFGLAGGKRSEGEIVPRRRSALLLAAVTFTTITFTAAPATATTAGPVAVNPASPATVSPATVSPATVSPATVSPHCQEDGYCLFSGTDFTGVKAVLPADYGCHPVSALGYPTARSAARGFGDGLGLVLYSDTTCGTHAATVYDEVPATSAKSYRLLPLPA